MKFPFFTIFPLCIAVVAMILTYNIHNTGSNKDIIKINSTNQSFFTVFWRENHKKYEVK